MAISCRAGTAAQTAGNPAVVLAIGRYKIRGNRPALCRCWCADRRRVGLDQEKFLHGAVVVESHQTGFLVNVSDFNFVLPLAFAEDVGLVLGRLSRLDRKSTRLNSSHL